MPLQRGLALPVALLLISVLITFFSALWVGSSQTWHLSQFNQRTLRAQELARSACQLTYQLMRNRGDTWAGSLSPPYTNDKFGANWASSRLGGNFEISVFDAPSLNPYPLPAGKLGSFRFIVGQAQVGNQSARATMSVKMTSPAVNFLSSSPAVALWGKIAGPIYVNSSPPGYAGDLWFIPQRQQPNGPGVNIFSGHNITFNGDARVMGQAYVRSCDYVGSPYALPELVLNGAYPQGTSLHHPDLTPLNNSSPQTGSLDFAGNSTFENGVAHPVTLPTVRQLMNSYRSGTTPSQLVTVNIDSATCPQGLLLEFCGGKAHYSKVVNLKMGDIYDRSLYLTMQQARAVGSSEGIVPTGSNPALWSSNFWTIPLPLKTAQSDSETLAELAWDDPTFANAPYPPALVGNFEGQCSPANPIAFPPGNGDVFPVYAHTRGATIAPATSLSRSGWTIIHLKARDLGQTSGEVPPLGCMPHVFVRGVVRGKVVVVYDADPDGLQADASQAPHLQNLTVLGISETSDDSTFKIAPSGWPGVPGGLHLEDDRIQTAVVAPPSGISEDYAVLISRGNLGFTGIKSAAHSWLIDGSGARFDYTQKLRDSDAVYEAILGSRYRTQMGGDNHPFNLVQAVCLGSAVGKVAELTNTKIGQGGNPDFTSLYNGGWYAINQYSLLGAGTPAGFSPSDPPNFIMVMRQACSFYAVTTIEGAITALSTESNGLNIQYDHRWRDFTAERLRDELLMPVGPIVLQDSEEN